MGRHEVERNQIIHVNAELVCDGPPIFLGQFVKWAVYNAVLRRPCRYGTPSFGAFTRKLKWITIGSSPTTSGERSIGVRPGIGAILHLLHQLLSLILNRPGVRRRGGGRRSTTVICAHSLTHSRKQLLDRTRLPTAAPSFRLRRQRPSSACHARQSGSAKTRFAPVIPESRVHERCEQKKPRNVQYQIELHSATLIAHHCLSCAATASPCPQTIPGSGSRHVHFVAPVGAGWRTVGERRLARANETGWRTSSPKGRRGAPRTFFKAAPFCIADHVVEGVLDRAGPTRNAKWAFESVAVPACGIGCGRIGRRQEVEQQGVGVS